MQKVSTQGVHQIRINSMRARAAVNFLMYFKTLSTKHFKQTAPSLRFRFSLCGSRKLTSCASGKSGKVFAPRSCRPNPTEAEIKYFILDSTAVRAVKQLNGLAQESNSTLEGSPKRAILFPARNKTIGLVFLKQFSKTNELIRVKTNS